MKTNHYEFAGDISSSQQDKIISKIKKDFPGGDYVIVTYSSRYEQYVEFVNSTLFAFNPQILADFAKLPIQVFEALYKIGDEIVNEALSILIFHKFRSTPFYNYLIQHNLVSYADALATYDHEEREIMIGKSRFYVYRTS